MDDFETPRPGDHMAGHDAGAILARLAKVRQERDVPAPKEQVPKEQVLVVTWGSWPW